MTRRSQLSQQGPPDHPGRPGQQHLHRSSPRTDWRELAHNTLVSGSVASLLSTFAVSCCSHWPSMRHTAVGYGIHHASSIFWAALHEYAIRDARRPSTVLATAAVTAATAYLVDYHVVPRRLTPGFDSRLSGGAMVAAYAAFAAGLGAAGWVRVRRHR